MREGRKEKGERRRVEGQKGRTVNVNDDYVVYYSLQLQLAIH